MKPVVANLSEDDIIAISSYLGSLPPQGSPPGREQKCAWRNGSISRDEQSKPEVSLANFLTGAAKRSTS